MVRRVVHDWSSLANTCTHMFNICITGIIMWDSEYLGMDLTEIIDIVHPLKIIVNIYNMKLTYFICQL